MSRSTVHVARSAAPFKSMRWLLATAAVAGLVLAWWSWSRQGQQPAAQPAGAAFAWNGAGAPTTTACATGIGMALQ